MKGAVKQPKRGATKVFEKKLKQTIALLEKTKDQRSLYDCKFLAPVLTQPGEHIVDFLAEQGVKDKDHHKVCTGVSYLNQVQNDYTCFHGERDIKSRKMMVLLNGTVDVYMPVPPDAMLRNVRDILSQLISAAKY